MAARASARARASRSDCESGTCWSCDGRVAIALAPVVLGAIGAVSIATPFLHVQYTERWFAWPNIILTAPVPIAVAVVTVLLLRSLAARQDYRPFFLTLLLRE